MKKIFCTLFGLLSFATIINAQNNKKSQSKKPRTSHSKQITKSTDSSQLSNRKIYQWKDGQRATPTGHNATPSNGSQYSALKKDTAILPKKEKE